jgi:hypothetical protein
MSARRLELAFTLVIALAVVTTLAWSAAAFAAPLPGTELWTHLAGSTPTADTFIDAARCPDGGVVAVGITNYDGLVPGSMDAFVVKYSPGGTVQWSHGYDNGESLNDLFVSVAVDRHGNVYAGGSADTSLTGEDYLVVRYDKNGVQKWARSIDGGHSLNDSFDGLVLDSYGRPCVTGGARKTLTSSQMYTFRLRPFDGDIIAQARYNGPAGTQYVDVWSMTRGDHDSLLVVGAATNGASVERLLVVRLTAKVRAQWARTYTPAGSTETWGVGIAKGPNGSLFALASTDRGSPGIDSLLLRYSATGRSQFVKRYDSGTGTRDWADAIAVDSSGNVFTTGRAVPASSVGARAFAIKWSAAGARRWVRFFPTTAGDASEYRDILPDQNGGVYVAGIIHIAASSGTNALVRHIRGAGGTAWTSVVSSGLGGDSFEALAFCGSGGVSAVGWYEVTAVPLDQDAMIQKRVR